MPFGDRTGPKGFGPATGRGAGYCTGYPTPGYTNYGPRWACGSGGRGRRNRYYATGFTGWQQGGGGYGWVDTGEPYGPIDRAPQPISRESRLSALKAQADNLSRTLETIRKEIETLEAESNRKDAE